MTDDADDPTPQSAAPDQRPRPGPVFQEVEDLITNEPEPPTHRVRKVLLRVFFVVAALGISTWILLSTFDDLDLDSILDAVRSLEDADLISLGAMWILWVGAQGLLTAALIPRLPVRRGVVAYLGPASITSVIPGPSDLPIRYRMLTSWGHSTSEATLAVAAGGIFSIGIKLVLPVVAAVGLLVSDAPIDGTTRTVVTVCLVVGIGIVVLAFVFGSEKRTEQAGRLLAPVWSTVMRLLRKPQPPALAEQMVAARSRAVQTLRERWLIASWGTVLTAATKFALLLMCLRFTGVSEGALSWTEVFVVFALVQGLTVIPITAGDAGVSEVAYIGLLTAAAGSAYVNQITAAVLIFRVLTWLLIIPVGLATLGFWKLQLRRHPTVIPEPT
ncbi:MAG: lysylphosphatidylglycerol synthase domain-containing protein [Ilumatobacteraceae bacterium]